MPLPLLLLLLLLLFLPLLSLPVLVLLRARFAVVGSSITRRAERRELYLRSRAYDSRWLFRGFHTTPTPRRHGGDFTSARRTSLDSARFT